MLFLFRWLQRRAENFDRLCMVKRELKATGETATPTQRPHHSRNLAVHEVQDDEGHGGMSGK